MKRFTLLFLVLISGLIAFYFSPDATVNNRENISEAVNQEPMSEVKSPEPNDYWRQVRSYPDGFKKEDYIHSLGEVYHALNANLADRAIDLNLSWQPEGPGNIGGRFNVLEAHPSNLNTIYAGAANGGIFKSTDGGNSWSPIFDDHAYLAVGAITIDPNDQNTVYVGTGDRNFGGGSHLGNGVYKSTDAGSSWSQIGLEQCGIVTEVIVDPTNSNKIFASTLGNTYEKTTDRGVYRSTDGGATWQNVLFVSDSCGAIDLVMNSDNPNVLYASTFNRINLPFKSKVTGPDAGIYKTTDGGNNWTALTNGLPSGEHSRIGLAISTVDPSILYAVYTDGSSQDILDVYKTTDAGANWSALNVHTGGLPTDAQGGFGWYFGQIFLNPYNNDQLIIPGVDMFKSEDGGANWSQNVPDWWNYTVHADKHAILFLSATSYIIATDGGLYKTVDNGMNWTDIENIPVTQFYHIAVDSKIPGLYGGGAQDNGSMEGNSATFNSWQRLYGGDGFRMTFLENETDGYYFETQWGGIIYYNTNTGSSQDLLVNEVNADDRKNWDTPYYLNEDNLELFVGTAHMQSMQAAPWGTYQTISGDLTKVGQGSYQGLKKHHTITEIEQAVDNDDIIYAGTSDGLVWRGDRNGPSWDWTNITGTLPDRYVTGIRTSPNNPGVVYVCFSGYKLNDPTSYLYRSDDYGASWQDVSGNLPGITVNDVYVVPNYDDEYLFAALDGGVFFSSDGGVQWDAVGTDLPMATVTELDVDYDNYKLIAGTYSRSMWSYDISWIDYLNGGNQGASVGEEESIEIKFFPNPASELVFFEGLNADRIQLYDQNGRKVLDKPVINSNGFGQLNISDLPSGIYYYKNGSRSGKVVKK